MTDDAINRVIKRLEDNKLSALVSASTWENIDDVRYALYNVVADTYRDALRILHEEYPFHD